MADVEYYQEGYEAFEEGKSETSYESSLTKKQRQSWKEGYNSAKRQAEAEEEKKKWERFSSCCPWNYKGRCRALADEFNDECSIINCGPLYFIQNYMD